MSVSVLVTIDTKSDQILFLLGLKAGIMHAFRHGRVSLLRSNGVLDKIVQDQVGHQDIRTTNKYTHSEEAGLRDMMEKLAASCTQKPPLYTN